MAEHIQNVRAVGDGVVRDEQELRGVAQIDAAAQLTAQEAGGGLEALHHFLFVFAVQGADIDPALAQVGGRVHMGDGEDTYDSLYYNGIPYSKILHDLRYKGGNHCHVDPDLDLSRRAKEIDGWFPAFGQRDAAASYLKNLGVAPGDIFLFFGNFHFVECKNGEYKYSRECGDFYREKDIQVIWGYLQVGEILSAPEKQKEAWWHPHSTDERTSGTANVIFKASERLSLDITKPGAGLLPFDKKRVLTLEGGN